MAVRYRDENGIVRDIPGIPGKTPILTIGTVTTLEPGEAATASLRGTAEEPILDLGIPRGATGEDAAIGEDIATKGFVDSRVAKIWYGEEEIAVFDVEADFTNLGRTVIEMVNPFILPGVYCLTVSEQSSNFLLEFYRTFSEKEIQESIRSNSNDTSFEWSGVSPDTSLGEVVYEDGALNLSLSGFDRAAGTYRVSLRCEASRKIPLAYLDGVVEYVQSVLDKIGIAEEGSY